MISVIIPLYNKESIIGKCLESVLSQDYDNFEVIVVDDGSTDRSAEIVETIDDCRIIMIQQDNGGPSKARNTGIKNAKGEWLYFIDADDCMEPGALKHFYKLSETHPDVDMFLGEVYFNNKANKTLFKKYTEGYVFNVFRSHFYDCFIQCSGSTMYKKNICKKFMYNEEIKRYEDLECLYRRYRNCCLFLADFPVATINTDFASSSHCRKDISEDFVGHLSFQGKTFWEKMCLYKLYLSERPYYVNQINKLYPILEYRYDLLMFAKFLNLSFVKNVLA